MRAVGLFLSTYENKLDAKGRVSVPASFRAVLDRNRSPLYIYKSLNLPCLEGCGTDRITQIVDAIDQMDSLSKDAEILQTMLFSAQEMKIDSDGRVLIGQTSSVNGVYGSPPPRFSVSTTTSSPSL